MSQNSNGGTPPVVPPAAPPTADQQGDTGDDKDKFRGISKALARAQAEAEELRAWKAEQEQQRLLSEGKKDEVIQSLTESSTTATAQAKKHAAEAEANGKLVLELLEQRVSALPEHIQKLDVEGLTTAQRVKMLPVWEELAGQQQVRHAVNVHAGAPRGAPQNLSPDDRAMKLHEDLLAKMKGGVTK